MAQSVRRPEAESSLAAVDGGAADRADVGAATLENRQGQVRAAPLMGRDQMERERTAVAPAWGAPLAESTRATGLEPKVYVVEDDPGTSECLRHLCASVDIPIEAYPTGEEFLESWNGERVGCVVTDVCLPGMSGFDLQRALARRHVGLPVIMITGYGDIRAAVRAMKAGAIDFIEKPFSGQLLLDRIAYAFRLHGRTRRAEAQREQTYRYIALLTRRERQVMDLVVAGKTNRGIATELGVSEKTVELHRGRVMTKLRAENLAELMRIAAWLEPE